MEKKQEFNFWMGGMTNLAVIAIPLTLFIALCASKYIVPFLAIWIGAITFKILPVERNVMIKGIKKLLGLNVIEMKMTAIAKYLKVKLVHVPEHYQCRKLKA